MGQKVNPVSFRLVRTRDWRSKWFANKKEFGDLLIEDQMIRDYLMKKPSMVGVSAIKIRRMSGKIEVTIVSSSRPCDW
jgi:small subunit ribosomal protein S3